MPRPRLTPEDRRARARARWDKILHGQAAPDPAPPGDAEGWRAALRARLGVPEAAAVEAACAYFDLPADYTRAALKRAFAAAILRAHPDQGGTDEAAREALRHYRALRRR